MSTESTAFDWHCFLKQWSQDFIDTFNDSKQLPEEVIEAGWLGYPGATEEEIFQAEKRLNVSLPPSYKEFLRVSNGWRQTTPFIYKIWSVEQIDRFARRRSYWLDSFLEAHFSSPSHSVQVGQLNGSLKTFEVPDSEYFIYGEVQDCSKVRVNYLQTALEISDRGESAIYLLNPQVVFEGGEWEAWFFSDDLPGADRYRSFQEMMEAEYENFLEMRETM